jgi:integrase
MVLADSEGNPEWCLKRFGSDTGIRTRILALRGPTDNHGERSFGLKTGEGWIGYRNGGESGLSKFLYFAYYPTPGAPQKFVNSKTNDVEDAYRQLLAARGASDRGVVVLPSEAARITYEHIRDQYLADRPKPQASKLGHLNKFFSKMKAVQITTAVIRQYIAKRRQVVTGQPFAGSWLFCVQCSNWQAAGEYITPEQFAKVLAALPDGKARGGKGTKGGPKSETNLQPFFNFLYATGCRLGAAQKILWNNVKEVNGVLIIEIAAGKTKTKRPLMLPLAGPILEPIAKDLKKRFRVSDQPVFESTNFRREWAKACAKAGIGTWDAKKLTRTGVRIHDCRASAAINLLASGVDEGLVLKIGGWKTRAMLDRYNVADVSRLAAALEKGGKFVTNLMHAAN